VVFAVAAGLSVLAAFASLLRGGRYVPPASAGAPPARALAGPAPAPAPAPAHDQEER
jgi:hypothetical protein